MPYLLTGRALTAQRQHQPVTTAMFGLQHKCIRLTLQHPLLVVAQQIDGPYWGFCQVGAALGQTNASALLELEPARELDDALLWLSHQWRDVGLSGRDFTVTVFEVQDDDELISVLPDAVAQLHRLGVRQVRQQGLLMLGQQLTLDFKHRQFYLDWWHGEYLGVQPSLGH